MKINALRSLSALVIGLSIGASLSSKAGADEFYPAFLVLRYFAEDTAERRGALAAARQQYLAKQGRDMATFQIFNDQGSAIGEGAWVAFASMTEVQAFVARDPYQQAKLYREVSIETVHVYLLDQWFSIVPQWRQGSALDAAHARYDMEVSRKPKPTQPR